MYLEFDRDNLLFPYYCGVRSSTVLHCKTFLLNKKYRQNNDNNKNKIKIEIEMILFRGGYNAYSLRYCRQNINIIIILIGTKQSCSGIKRKNCSIKNQVRVCKLITQFHR